MICQLTNGSGRCRSMAKLASVICATIGMCCMLSDENSHTWIPECSFARSRSRSSVWPLTLNVSTRSRSGARLSAWSPSGLRLRLPTSNRVSRSRMVSSSCAPARRRPRAARSRACCAGPSSAWPWRNPWNASPRETRRRNFAANRDPAGLYCDWKGLVSEPAGFAQKRKCPRAERLETKELRAHSSWLKGTPDTKRRF